MCTSDAQQRTATGIIRTTKQDKQDAIRSYAKSTEKLQSQT